MQNSFSTQISAWFQNIDQLRLMLILALALVAVFGLLWRKSSGQGRDLDAAVAQAQAGRHQAELRLGRMEAAQAAQQDRLSEISEERDELRDALHSARQLEAQLRRQMAEVELAAEKDREGFEREIAILRELREEMTGQFRLMANESLRVQGEDMQKAHGLQLNALLTPFRDQVAQFQTELQARNKATDEERARLKEQIEYLHKRSEQISHEAVALTRALKGDSQRQGAWGEMILERILEDSGLQSGTHYTAQHSQRDDNGRLWRPDVVVKLPQKKVLVIDSKVSLLAYEQAVNCEDPQQRAAALRRHVASVRAHITALGAKGYQMLDEASVDYVLMFIPIEGAFSEALRVDPDLARFAMEQRVGLSTPTTLMLMLRTVDHIWTVERRESNAMQIAGRAGQLYDKLHGFVMAMEDVGQSLERAQKSHATAMDRLTRGSGNVIRQAEMLRELGARTQKRIGLDHDGGPLFLSEAGE